ncbi:MAG TPA: DUF1236 domain-containing protein [Pseudolabrys sp.]|nr:DUF1236 domain-containing protein [Pseudolabrys sp.]
MQLRNIMLTAALAAAVAAPTAAAAAVVATAVTPLNVRSGPGPQYPIVGAIPGRGHATITGCIQGSLWCQVTFNGRQGWAYSRYLMATLSGRSLAVSEAVAQIPAVTYAPPAATVRAAVPAVTYARPAATVGAAVAEPVVSGTVVERPAAAAPMVITPPGTVREYVYAHPVQPVYLNGEVVVGAGLPPEVALAPVPGYQYEYAYVNGAPVLVEPQTREIAYVYQ